LNPHSILYKIISYIFLNKSFFYSIIFLH